MDKRNIQDILNRVADHSVSADEAALLLREQPFEDLGYAKVDHHRALRQGIPEVIYGEGKTAAQIVGISSAMRERGQETILVTRLDDAKAAEVGGTLPLEYHGMGRIGVIGKLPAPDGAGRIAIVTGGTSDQPVAEEAAITCAALGNEVVRVYDVGVAGIHRLLSCLDDLMAAKVVVAIAGMEGALASVVGGLVDCPVIGVPTSVGYGTALGGVTALLSMLNSCASGVSVVNIDNGFGAGYLASMINHMEA